jgi:hypothetical protein
MAQFFRELSMWETVAELGICLLIGAIALAVVAWEIATGNIAYLDGIALSLISLTLGGFFLFDVLWSYRRGELKELLKKKETEVRSQNEEKSRESKVENRKSK